MSELRLILQASLGGAVFGSFPGIFGGGLLGGICGLFLGDLSLGLDGALIGGGVGFLGGGLYGIFLAIREKRMGANIRPPSGAAPSPDKPDGLSRPKLLPGRTEGAPAPSRPLSRCPPGME